jgi:hypothetical protein
MGGYVDEGWVFMLIARLVVPASSLGSNPDISETQRGRRGVTQGQVGRKIRRQEKIEEIFEALRQEDWKTGGEYGGTGREEEILQS